ncbi:helix-turn-helix domain containing protein [Nonomuraea sp. MCN248]|uniref:Helix-turn-helix domain containing protein n=1 Tax=Nonomuraea corallina TaxID=2989783 RepID=A0ABT4SC08_9ACTN|nr:TetR/AcrR family transcriptional regulator [Nonomuraea corallina]MDA0634520.1 helix-turn-helix domain containing protein [Nonomuraea corallina]
MSPRRAAAVPGSETLPGHLIAAAERLIARDGAAGLTVRAIAKEARVADGVLYNHFADKEELIARALLAHVRTVERGLPPLPRGPGEGDLETNLRAYVDYGVALHLAILPAFAGLLGRPDILARFAALGGGPTLPGAHAGGPDGGLRGQLARYLRAEQAAGRVAAQADPEAAATMVVGACHELVLPHLLAGAPAGELRVPPDFAGRVVTTCLHGLTPR